MIIYLHCFVILNQFYLLELPHYSKSLLGALDYSHHLRHSMLCSIHLQRWLRLTSLNYIEDLKLHLGIWMLHFGFQVPLGHQWNIWGGVQDYLFHIETWLSYNFHEHFQHWPLGNQGLVVDAIYLHLVCQYPAKWFILILLRLRLA